MAQLYTFVPALIFVITAVLLYAAFLRYRSRRGGYPKSLEEMIAMGAEKAVARARSRYGVTLDYSIESIRAADSVLQKVYQEYAAAPRLVDLNSVAFVFGAYIGETIRRNHSGCSWERNHQMAGENSYPLHWGQGTCFPIGWCIKRISDGEEDNLWVKYELAKQIAAGQLTPKTNAASAG